MYSMLYHPGHKVSENSNGQVIFLVPLKVHCNENSIYVFIFWELRGLSPNFHIHVYVSDLYTPRIGLPILLQENMWTDSGNI
jgi:hypothetical protein